MTFDEFYASTIEPTLPTDCPQIVRKASREVMAACWNAALDAAHDYQVGKNHSPNIFSELKVKNS